MIKVPEDILKEFPIITKTDRDCEVPILLEFLDKIQPIDSLLDIGAHSTNHEGYSFYAPEIRKRVERYDGIDILDDPITIQIVDDFFVGNAITLPLKLYDIVICVSTIEHAGVSTYKAEDVKLEQEKLFSRCLELTKKYMWISFPIGLPYVYPNELSVIEDRQLTHWERLTSNFKIKERFLYNQGPQAGHPWYEHTKREVAVKIPYIDFVGNSSIAVLEIDKT